MARSRLSFLPLEDRLVPAMDLPPTYEPVDPVNDSPTPVNTAPVVANGPVIANDQLGLFRWRMADRFADTAKGQHAGLRELRYDKSFLTATRFDVTFRAAGSPTAAGRDQTKWTFRHADTGEVLTRTGGDVTVKLAEGVQYVSYQTPAMAFNQSMTIPLELKLTATADGPRKTWTPVKELEALRVKSHEVEPLTLKPDTTNPLASVKAELVELRAEFEPAADGEVTFTVRGATIVYDTKK